MYNHRMQHPSKWRIKDQNNKFRAHTQFAPIRYSPILSDLGSTSKAASSGNDVAMTVGSSSNNGSVTNVQMNIIYPDNQAGNSSKHEEEWEDGSWLQIQEEAITRMDELAGRYQRMNDRLDGIERQIVDLTKNVRRSSAGVRISGTVGAPMTSPSPEPSNSTGKSRNESGDSYDKNEQSESRDDNNHAVTAFTHFQGRLADVLNSGYLDSVKSLRETMMVREWDMTVKHQAQRRAISMFERHCAMHGIEDVPFDVMTQLYDNPEDLGIITDVKLRMLARSMLEECLVERQLDVYNRCTDSARELAKLGATDLIPGAKSVVQSLMRFLPPPLRFLT